MSSATADSALEGIRFYLKQARELSFSEARRILATELLRDPSFREAWREAQDLYPEKHLFGGDVMEEECYLAVISYTLETPNICKKFNALCREAEAAQWSWEEFPFKSLWYFLVRAFEKLPPCSAGSLFRGVKRFYTNSDSSVTFGQFVSASRSEDVASRFGRGGHVLTLDGVPAEFVRDISLYSIYGRHREVLLWPFCEFQVVAKTPGKILQFVSAMPWVERGSRTQLITTSLVGTAPGTASRASVSNVAKITTSVPEISEVSNTSHSPEFPPIHFTYLTEKSTQPSIITGANDAQPQLPMTPSRVSEVRKLPSSKGCPLPLSESEQMSKGMKISESLDMSPNLAECVAQQLCRTTQNMSNMILDPSETPKTLGTMDFQHLPSNWVMPETPESSRALDSSVPHDYSAMCEILKPTRAADVQPDSSHTKEHSLLRDPRAFTVGKMSEMSSARYRLWCPRLQANQTKVNNLKPCGTLTALPKEHAQSHLSLSNYLTTTHVLPAPERMELEACHPKSDLAASRLVERSPYTVMPPAMVWSFGSVTTDQPISNSIRLIPTEVLIFDNSELKTVQAGRIALLIFFCITMAGVMAVINVFFAK